MAVAASGQSDRATLFIATLFGADAVTYSGGKGYLAKNGSVYACGGIITIL